MILAFIAGWGLADLAIFVVIVAVLIGIVFIVLRQSGIGVPSRFVQIVWLAVLAIQIAILAIRFVASL